MLVFIDFLKNVGWLNEGAVVLDTELVGSVIF